MLTAKPTSATPQVAPKLCGLVTSALPSGHFYTIRKALHVFNHLHRLFTNFSFACCSSRTKRRCIIVPGLFQLLATQISLRWIRLRDVRRYGTATTFFFFSSSLFAAKASGEEEQTTASIAETPLTIAALLVDTLFSSSIFLSAIDVLEEDALMKTTILEMI